MTDLSSITIWLWVVVKTIAVRKEPDPKSQVLDVLNFGDSVMMIRKPITNGYVKVEYCQRKNAKKKHITGWIFGKAMTKYQVEDYASLWYDNMTGRPIQVVSSYYNGKPIGFISPEESVAVAAKVGDVCLTNRGWTKFSWLTKRHEIFDQGVIDEVLLYALAYAVKDYRTVVNALKKHDYKDMKEFGKLVDQLDEIGVFFLDKNILNVDKIPGIDRFNSLNEELEIDTDWIKDKLRKRDSWRKKVKKT